MPDQRKRLIVALLDRTGSMAPVREDTEGAFNSFITQQQELTAEVNDEVLVTLHQFDSSTPGTIETLYHLKPLAEVPPLTLEPRAFTPLHDAFGKALLDTDKHLGYLPVNERPGHVVFVVMTDGQDNQPGEFTREGVRALVEQRQASTDPLWEFIFLGVGIDAFAVGGGYGLADHQTVSVPRSSEGVYAAYAGTQAVVSRVRRST